MTTRKELIEALRLRYRSATVSDRIKILDEFVALTCYHRKHAVRVLRGEFRPATDVGVRGAMEQRTDLRVFDKTFVLSNTLSAGTGALKASDFRPKNWFDESKFTTLFTP